MLTESDRKLLTEYLGECWHIMEDNGPYATRCHKCRVLFGATHTSDWSIARFYHTFDTIQDFYDLKVKMVEKGEWESFLLFAAESFNADKEMMNFTNWLINPKRCQTVAEWLKTRRNDL